MTANARYVNITQLLDHLTLGCTLLAKNDRRQSCCVFTRTSLNVQSTEHRNDKRRAICDCEDVTFLWNQAVHTDREGTANSTDIIIKTTDNVAVPVDRNVT